MPGPRSTRPWSSSTTCNGSATIPATSASTDGSATRSATSGGRPCSTCSATSDSTPCRGPGSARSHVTGVDFSEPAIAFANAAGGPRPACRTDPDSSFGRLRPARSAGGRDVRRGLHRARCAGLAARPRAMGAHGRRLVVKPGGIFYIHEGHPVMWTIDDEQTEPERPALRLRPTGAGTTLSFPVEGSYADAKAERRRRGRAWLEPFPRRDRHRSSPPTGLRIELLDEKRVLDWPVPFLTGSTTGATVSRQNTRGTIPLMYSLRARKA